MRAMSLGLIKGSMDEVDQSINISWVQPRVLDKGQLSVLSAQLDTWSERCVFCLPIDCTQYSVHTVAHNPFK
jgi:hypothetical protein